MEKSIFLWLECVYVHLDSGRQQWCQQDAIILFTIILCLFLCLYYLYYNRVLVCRFLFIVDESALAHAGPPQWSVHKTILPLKRTHKQTCILHIFIHTHRHTLPGSLTYRHFTLVTSTNWIRVHSLCTSTHPRKDTTCTYTHTRAQTRAAQQAQNGRNAALKSRSLSGE